MILSKVSKIASLLNATKISVSGHTDSLGGTDLNRRLSTERAQAVQAYLKENGFQNIAIESKGYGFEKPLASNRTSKGRAQNRRVDILITPASAN